MTMEVSCKSTVIGVGRPVDFPSPEDFLKSMVNVLSTSVVNCTFLSSPNASRRAISTAAANSSPL